MTTSKKMIKHPSHPTKGALNGASGARVKVIRRAPGAAALLRSTSPEVKAIGAAAVAIGVAAGASVLMRKPLTKALRGSVRAATSASDRLAKTGSNLLVSVGLRRRSFLSRMWPELSAIAGVVAAAGATTFFWRGRRLEPMITGPRETSSRNKDHEEPSAVDRASHEQTPFDVEGVRHAHQ
jgi:hypothetical protein